jgi:hypothetical protein
MKQKKSIKIIISLILFVLFFSILLTFKSKENQKTDINYKIYETVCGKYKKGVIKIGEETLFVDIADDECKMSLGLSGRAPLIDEGMFFIFPNVGNYGFWMKDMNFSIDIFWIDENFDIVGIEKNLSPDTFPQSFGSNYSVKYVLEVPALYSDKNNIKIGDKIIYVEK